jgi:diguanylate cyclase (GGDEF)-like protein
LQALGSLLRRLVRAGDKAGRWDGEEFLIVALDTDLTQGVALAERLRAGLERHRFPHDITVTASFGVATWAWGRSIGQLLQEADRHLYAAKDAGRNTVRAQPALALGA